VLPTSPTIRRAPKELQGFAKPSLEPGEKKEVRISMKLKYATGSWDESCKMWKCENDTYKVLVVTSSQGPFVEGGFKMETFWWKGLFHNKAMSAGQKGARGKDKKMYIFLIDT
jgi:hypothetical protein